MSKILLKSLRRFYIDILWHQVLPCLVYSTFNLPVVAKRHYCFSSRRKSNIVSEFQLNLQQYVNIFCFSFNKMSIKRKNCAPTNFDLTINFVFFDLITLESVMVSAWNLSCGRFINFVKDRKILTLLTFACPTDQWSYELSLNVTRFNCVQVNANSSILPGVKLGTLAVDTCTIDTHTVKMVSALLTLAVSFNCLK